MAENRLPLCEITYNHKQTSQHNSEQSSNYSFLDMTGSYTSAHLSEDHDVNQVLKGMKTVTDNLYSRI